MLEFNGKGGALRPLSIAMACVAVLTATCRAADLPPLRADRPPVFTADVAISMDAQGHPALSVAVSLPYEELQWVRVPAGYGAGAEVTIVIQPRRSGPNYGDSWERRIVVAEFQGTSSPSVAVADRKSFSVPPGHYEIRVGVRDLNSDGTSSAHADLEVPDYSKAPVGFADLVLGVVDSTGAFRAIPTREFGINVRRLAAQVTLFDRRDGEWPRVYPFHYRILDDQGEAILSGRRDVSVAGSAVPVLVSPDSSDLFIGAYVYEIELVEGRSRWRAERSFQVDESGPPRGREFERILEPLAYIAEPGEIEHLRSLPTEEQARGWTAFWRRRDPTPETDRNEAMLEFFRRLRYAEQRFQSFGPGWRSDMGRIYIKFGPPDQVESRAATTDGPQIEVWYYNRPYRRFVFADREGFGRYVLLSPTAE